MDKQPIEIYFYDLSAEMQQKIIDLLGENGNYDVFPIATIYADDDHD